LLSVPSGHEQEQRAVFEEALSNYRDFSPGFSYGGEDFTSMVVRFWRSLPQGSALEAIDAILDKAKDQDPSDVTKAADYLPSS
jgi:hypothetical protein